MHPTNNNGEVFPCTKCGNHAQPTPQASGRKKVVIHDKEENEHYYISITNGQLALLEWLENECIFDNDRYEWEVLNEHEFEEI